MLRGEVNKLLPIYQENKCKYNVLAYASSIIELAEAILILNRNGNISGIPILYRTFSETYVDFHNLSSDLNYSYRLQSNRIKEWIRVIDALDPKNLNWLKQSNELQDLVSFKKDLLAEKEELDDKFKPIKIREKFKIAGLEDFYQTMYNELCSDSHSNLRSVFSRLNLDPNDQKIQLCISTISKALDELEINLVKVFGVAC
jgi:hypothetical protein